MKSVFEPYRDMKDNLHKDLATKLLATDNVIKQTITQIFRSKVCWEKEKKIFDLYDSILDNDRFIKSNNFSCYTIDNDYYLSRYIQSNSYTII